MPAAAALPRLLLVVAAAGGGALLAGARRGGRALGVSVVLLPVGAAAVEANPLSHPYIAYRTSPRQQGQEPGGQDSFVDHDIAWNPDPTVSKVRSLDERQDQQQQSSCRTIRFALGISKRVHGDWTAPISAPPVVYPALPASGPGRQVLLVQYEHLDLLSPSSSSASPPRDPSASSAGSAGGGGRRGSRRAGDKKKKAAATKAEAISSSTSSGGVKEMLLQAVEYPLLLEGSHFWASPIVADPSGDGRPKALLADSTGGIYVVGLTAGPMSSGGGSGRHRQRAFQSAQVPRLYVRREWVDRRVRSALGSNSTPPAAASEEGGAGAVPAPAAGKNGSSSGAAADGASVDDPYHTYFEYYYSGLDASKHDKLLQGVSASAFSQESTDRQRLLDRRRRQKRERVQMLARKHQQEQHGEENPSAAADGEPAAAGEKGRAILPPKKYDDDFAGDDLEYMLAKQRNVEERGILAFDDDYGRKHRQEQQQPQEHREDEPRDSAQAQRRRLQEEGGRSPEVKDAAAGDAEVHAQHHHGGEGGDGGGGEDQQEREKNDGAAKESLQEEGSRRGNREGAGEGEKDGRGRSYDDLAGDGPPRVNDIVDVDQQRATDDMIGPDAARDDPKYAMKYDDYYRYRHGGADDTYRGHNERHREYYDTKHYIRIPPHVLCTPVLAELPKLYTNTDEKEDILFVAVSYFLDEDEYEGLTGYKRFTETDRGDETEASRGMYVASAVMAYILGDSPRWMGQTHLDLSTDYSAPENLTVVGALPIEADVSKMGAFALGSPTVADIDGDGNMEVLLGTSMGMVYAFDARQMYKKTKFPIQMPFPVESRILVEDVRDDTNLEIFVADIGGNVVCLNHEASPLWRRNLATSVGLKDVDIKGSSPMALGDVNGDGVMDVTIAVLVHDRSFIFALNAATGEDLPSFPIEFAPLHFPKIPSDSVHHKLSQPLLVDLHLDQSFLSDYLRRNGTKWDPRNGLVSTPGSASGLHIVYPQDQYLHVIEAGSGCSQVIPMGDTISTMVQVDDVHGTGRLDLIVSTEAGDVITLESPTPYHPLNTWTQGELRGRMNGHAHGYSASQGIFVHEASRQYVDVFGVYVPITFEIFDNRPNIQNEKDKRQYWVEIRDGPSSKRALFRAKYEEPGVYTDRFYVRYGPGFYTFHVVMLTSHGLLYEDTFHVGYNVRFMDGFGTLLWLPLLLAAVPILLFGSRKSNWQDEETDGDGDGHALGILGRSLPS